MALLVRKIHGREYLYRAYRSGGKVVQKYLGPLQGEALHKLAGYRDRNKLPAFLRPLFWDVDPDALDLRKHARYIAERILELGDLQALEWLQARFAAGWLKEVAAESRRLSLKSKNFWALWFHGGTET